MTFFKNHGGLEGPYHEHPTNVIYHLLFCDNIDLFKTNSRSLEEYPWNVLLSDKTNLTGLQQIAADTALETRARMLAWNQLAAHGIKVQKKELLAVIVEVGLDGGLDVLASFKDGKARYINQTGKMIIWETTNESSDRLTRELFMNSIPVIKQMGPWTGKRRRWPDNGSARISFIVSDGLYFGEAPTNTLFGDPLARAPLLSAASLMKYLTDKVLSTIAN